MPAPSAWLPSWTPFPRMRTRRHAAHAAAIEAAQLLRFDAIAAAVERAAPICGACSKRWLAPGAAFSALTLSSPNHLPLPLQAQMDSYAAMADALAQGDGPAQGLSEDFYISATWLQ